MTVAEKFSLSTSATSWRRVVKDSRSSDFALDWGGWSLSLPVRPCSWEKSFRYLWVASWVGPRTGDDEKMPQPLPEEKSQSFSP